MSRREGCAVSEETKQAKTERKIGLRNPSHSTRFCCYVKQVSIKSLLVSAVVGVKMVIIAGQLDVHSFFHPRNF